MVQFLEGLFANPKECVGFQGNIQLALLMLAYGYGLGRASMLISHGTEKLMLLPAYTGLIGSVVLPLLGAVPDGAFILFSGLGPNAQDDLAVGVGALAGSTILLVTGVVARMSAPWSRLVCPRLRVMYALEVCLCVCSDVGPVYHQRPRAPHTRRQGHV